MKLVPCSSWPTPTLPSRWGALAPVLHVSQPRLGSFQLGFVGNRYPKETSWKVRWEGAVAACQDKQQLMQYFHMLFVCVYICMCAREYIGRRKTISPARRVRRTGASLSWSCSEGSCVCSCDTVSLPEYTSGIARPEDDGQMVEQFCRYRLSILAEENGLVFFSAFLNEIETDTDLTQIAEARVPRLTVRTKQLSQRMAAYTIMQLTQIKVPIRNCKWKHFWKACPPANRTWTGVFLS